MDDWDRLIECWKMLCKNNGVLGHGRLHGLRAIEKPIEMFKTMLLHIKKRLLQAVQKMRNTTTKQKSGARLQKLLSATFCEPMLAIHLVHDHMARPNLLLRLLSSSVQGSKSNLSGLESQNRSGVGLGFHLHPPMICHNRG